MDEIIETAKLQANYNANRKGLYYSIQQKHGH